MQPLFRNSEAPTGLYTTFKVNIAVGRCRTCQVEFQAKELRVGPKATTQGFGKSVEVAITVCTKCFSKLYKGRSITIDGFDDLSEEDKKTLSSLPPVKNGLLDKAKKKLRTNRNPSTNSVKGRPPKQKKSRSRMVFTTPLLIQICNMHKTNEGDDRNAISQLLPLLCSS